MSELDAVRQPPHVRTYITRRRDQVTYKGNPVAADQVIGGIIICATKENRAAWLRWLNSHPLRFNHFVEFDDVQGPAIQFGHAPWASLDHPYVIH